MELVHAGLGAGSMENADRFYVGVLGLSKSDPKELPSELSAAIFGIDRTLTMVRYTGDTADFEVFVHPGYRAPRHEVLHSCIEVEDRERFLSVCRNNGVSVNEVQKGSATIVFITDFDGNLFEVKPKG